MRAGAAGLLAKTDRRMPYRRTERVARQLAARQGAIVAAARALAAEGGIGSVQIATVAERANIAAGTVYRYFSAKRDLIAALVTADCDLAVQALAQAADAAPDPLSALAAAIAALAARAIAGPRLAYALLAEPAAEDLAGMRLRYRQLVAAEFERRIQRATEAGHLPEQDPAVAAAALVGGLIEGLIGPLVRVAQGPAQNPAQARTQVQTLTLFMLRGLGVIDVRARGLVVQIALPPAAG
jgi:AcrR family transcriptional regulator